MSYDTEHTETAPRGPLRVDLAPPEAEDCASPRLDRLADEIRGILARLRKNAALLADIGDRLAEAKGELKEARCWRRWLAGLSFTRQTAENYIALAGLRRSLGDHFEKLLAAGLRTTYRLARGVNGLPPLTPATRLPLPGGGEKTIAKMTADELADALRAATPPKPPRPAESPVDRVRRLLAALPVEDRRRVCEEVHPADTVTRGVGHRALRVDSRPALAAGFAEEAARLRARAAAMRSLPGRLDGPRKQAALGALEAVRREVLRWPAWANPNGKSSTSPSPNRSPGSGSSGERPRKDPGRESGT